MPDVPLDFDNIPNASAVDSVIPIPAVTPIETDLAPDDPSKVRMFKGDQEMYFPNKQENILLANEVGFQLASQDMAGRAYQLKLNEKVKQLQDEAGGFGADINPALPFRKEHPEFDNDKIFGSKDGTLRLVDPQGNQVDANDKEAIQMLSQGYKFEDPNAQLGLDSYLKLYQDSGANGINSAGAFIKGAGTLGSTGVENITSPITDPDTSNNVRYARIAARLVEAQEHSTAKMAGGIAGQIALAKGLGAFSGGNAVRTGIAGALAPAGSGLVRQIGAAAVGEAGAAAVVNSPQMAIQTLIDKDPQAAAESLAISLGTGAILGPISAGISKLASRAAPEIPEVLSEIDPGHLKEVINQDVFAQEHFSQFLGSSPEEIEQIKKYFSPNAFKSLTDKTTQEALTNLDEDQRKIVMKNITEAAEGDVEKTTSNLRDLASGEHMELLPKLDSIAEAAELPKLASVIGSFERLGEKPEAYSTVTKLTFDLEKLADKDGTLPLVKAQSYAGKLAGEIDWKQEGNLINDTKKLAYNSLMKSVLDSTDSIAKSSGDVKLIRQVLADNTTATLANQLHTDSILDLKKPIVETTTPKLVDSPFTDFAQNTAGKLLKKIAKGAAVGAGYHVAGPIGGYSAHLLSSWLEHGDTKIPGFFKKIGDTAATASYIVGDAIHIVQSKIDALPITLKDAVEMTPVQIKKTMQHDPMKNILGSEANGLTKVQQFNRLAERSAGMIGNPATLDSRVNELTDGLKPHHPELASALASNLKQKILYIDSIIPKNPNPPTAFIKEKKFEPSPSQLYDMNKQLAVVNNPFHVIHEVAAGTLISKQIDTLRQLYPAVLKKMQDEVATIAHDNKIKLSYQQRLAMGRFMDQPIERSVQSVQQLQSVYGPVADQPQPPPQPKRSKGGSKINPDKLPAAQGTMAQKMMA